MRIISSVLILIIFSSQFVLAEPTGIQRKTRTKIAASEEPSKGNGKTIAAVILIGSIAAIVINETAAPSGEHNDSNVVFAGLAVGSGIALFRSGKNKEKQINLNVSEQNEPLLSFRYNF